MTDLLGSFIVTEEVNIDISSGSLRGIIEDNELVPAKCAMPR